MSINHVLKACQSIVESGKKPTTALVKSKLKVKVSLATIIKGVGVFQSTSQEDIQTMLASNDKEGAKATNEDLCECACAHKLTLLEQNLFDLQNQVKALQDKVQELTNS